MKLLPQQFGSSIFFTLTLVALALFFAGLASLYSRDLILLTGPLPAVDTRALPQLPERRHYRSIMQIDDYQALTLMGTMPSKPEPIVIPAIEEIPDTQLNLTLTGVFASENPAVAAAMIKIEGQPPRYFRIGQEVVAGTILEIVAADGVTLRSKKAYEKLMFTAGNIWREKSSTSLAALQSRPHPAAAGPRPLSSTPSTQPTPVAQSLPSSVPVKSVAHLTLQERLSRLRANMPYNPITQ